MYLAQKLYKAMPQNLIMPYKYGGKIKYIRTHHNRLIMCKGR